MDTYGPLHQELSDKYNLTPSMVRSIRIQTLTEKLTPSAIAAIALAKLQTRKSPTKIDYLTRKIEFLSTVTAEQISDITKPLQ